MPLLYFNSNTTRIDATLDIPLILNPNVPHYMSIQNLDFSYVFANTTTPNNELKVVYYPDVGDAITKTYKLEPHRCMELQDVYRESNDATDYNGVRYFDIVLDVTIGRVKIVPKSDINELMTTNKIRLISFNSSSPNTLLQSTFMDFGGDMIRFVRNQPMNTFTSIRQPSVSKFNTLFLTASNVVNESRTFVNKDCVPIPMLTAIPSDGNPFERLHYVNMNDSPVRITGNSLSNFQFILKNEFNEEPEVIEYEGTKADVEFSVLVKID